MLTVNFDPFPIVKTERLTLRQLRESDKHEMHAMRSDPKLMHFIPRPMTKNNEEAATLIGTMNESISKNEMINWAITFSGEDKLIGMVGFFRMKPEHYRAEIGYMLHADYHGKKVMEEAVNGALRFGFDKLKFHSVEAVISPENIPSQKLIEKCGFVKEAHFKDYEFYNGEFRDILVYSKLTKQK
ncbi:MAG TPA: GNAT family N-acetyltransferase [Bacteroidia bacterium]|nr:GNAT family N-acetyltransferase [Bacteroidia bacterium]